MFLINTRPSPSGITVPVSEDISVLIPTYTTKSENRIVGFRFRIKCGAVSFHIELAQDKPLYFFMVLHIDTTMKIDNSLKYGWIRRDQMPV